MCLFKHPKLSTIFILDVKDQDECENCKEIMTLIDTILSNQEIEDYVSHFLIWNNLVFISSIKTSKVWKIFLYLHFNNVFRLRKRFQQSVIGYLIQILMSNVLIWLPTILMTFGSYWLTNFFGLTWFAKRLAFVLDDNFVMLFFMINLNWKKLSFSYSPEK